MKPDKFQKKRIERMSKRCAEMLCRQHGRSSSGDYNIAQGVFSRFAEEVLEIMEHLPNKEKTASFVKEWIEADKKNRRPIFLAGYKAYVKSIDPYADIRVVRKPRR
jgi:hypothetical protein